MTVAESTGATTADTKTPDATSKDTASADTVPADTMATESNPADATPADATSAETDHPGIRVTWQDAPLAARALLAGVFVNRLGAFIQVFLVLFLTARGFSPLQAGFALGIYGAGSVVGVLAGGELTDRLGSRRTILVSMSGTAVMVLAVLYLSNYVALLVAVAAVGAVSQAFRPASAALLSELTPKHRQVMIFAMYRLAFNLGSTAAPLIGAALVAVSYNLLFWGEAVAALGYAAIAVVALPRHQRGSAAEKATKTDGPEPASARSSYLAVLSDRRYVLFLLALLINAIVYMQYLSTLPVAMRAAGLGTGWFSAMVALNGFIVITCELLATKVVQRWPMRVAAVVGFALLGGGLAIYALPLGIAAFVIGTLVWSLAEIVGGPTMQAYPAMAGPDRLRGRYIGSSSAMFGLGSAIGPIVGLAVWDQVGRAVWLWYGIAAAAGVVLAWQGIRSKTVEAPAAPSDAAAEGPVRTGAASPAAVTAISVKAAAVKAAVLKMAAGQVTAIGPPVANPAASAAAAAASAAKAAAAAASAAAAAASAASAAAAAATAAAAAEAAAAAASAAAAAASAAASAAAAVAAAVASTAAAHASTPDTADPDTADPDAAEARSATNTVRSRG